MEHSHINWLPPGNFFKSKMKKSSFKENPLQIGLISYTFSFDEKKEKKWKIRKSVCHGVISRPVGMEFLFPKRSGWFPNIIVCKIFILKQFQIKLLSWWRHWKIWIWRILKIELKSYTNFHSQKNENENFLKVF